MVDENDSGAKTEAETGHPDDCLIGQKRHQLGYEAILQAGALTGVIEREIAREETETAWVMPALLRRLEALHGVLLDVLDAQEIPLPDLREIVHGPVRSEVAHG